ncbi:hypothetical protein niasHT_032939 [Heterodera trifolii]|uniref:Fido domain-containing protein n=1 Tax=Heterodera trifolii TaxID=157864 RepID=A0ABD2INY9_9BILA
MENDELRPRESFDSDEDYAEARRLGVAWRASEQMKKKLRILALHHTIMVGEKDCAAAAGVYRLTDVFVGDDPIGVPAWEIAGAMTAFCQWLKAEEEKLHEGGGELARFAAEAHLRLVQIHPAEDGNGRLARLLMNLLLNRREKGPIILRESFHDQYDECMRTGNIEALVVEINVELNNLEKAGCSNAV